MPNKYDENLILKIEKETKEKLRFLADKSERSMSAWVRNQIHYEYSKLETSDKEPIKTA